jgi:RNA polymerase sigma-70 factor (ECF subfamily)
VESAPATAVISRLVDSHRQFLAFLEKRVESRAAAEDILQAAFVRTLEGQSAIRDEESAVAWFYRILRNAVIDHYRHRASTERTLEAFGRDFARGETAAPEIHGEICGCLMSLLETLKPEYREALQSVDVAEDSLKTLAQRSGITAANAAVRVHRARAALRKQVIKACGTCAEHGCVDCRCQSASGKPGG